MAHSQMSQKELEQKKAKAAKHLSSYPDASTNDLVNLFGLSQGTAQRVRTKFRGGVLNGASPPHISTLSPSAPPVITSPPPPEPEPSTLDFADSPAPVEAKNVVDSALGSLKKMLGMSEDKAAPKARSPLSAKLDAKRQAFVDATAPTVALAAMALAAWMWGHLGAEYGILAPEEDVALRIVEPLLRVYARHAAFLTEINPDYADIGASLLALVGYVHVSLKLYQEIKQEQEEIYEEQESRDRGIRRATRGARSAESEGVTRNAGGGHAPLSRASGPGPESNGSHDGGPGSLDLSHFSSKEAAQYAALSRLSQLDYQHRARRSGRSA